MDSAKFGNSLIGSLWALEVAYGNINGVVKMSFTLLSDFFEIPMIPLTKNL